MTATFVDCERPIRDWLRTANVGGIGSRVYVGLPTDVTYPALDMSLVDGGIDPGEAPVANALISFSAWADTRPAASEVIWALVDLLHSSRYVVLDSTLRLLGVRIVTGPIPRYDADGFHRFILDAALAVRVP